MIHRCCLTLCLLMWSSGMAVSAVGADAPAAPAAGDEAPDNRPAEPPYDPTSHYDKQQVQGWTVLVNRDLLADHAETAEAALELLRVKLYEIERVVPGGAVAELKQVPIWLEVRDKRGRHPCACYHPSRGWLRSHGYNPAKAKAMEIANAAAFLEWTKQQPWMVLHELAHAYHDRVLGFEHEEIAAAWDKAKSGGKYDQVLRWSGKMTRHYALNNPKEYFAEATEAYFGVNDFYPFVNAELKQHDPDMHELVGKLWER